MNKHKVLIVGGFPDDEIVKGGIVLTCRILEQSDYFKVFDIYKFDTTQSSFPPKGKLIRLYYASRRFFRFIRALVVFRPDLALIFSSNGLSLVEKSIMAALVRLSRSKAILFPRGEGIISKSDRINKILARILLQYPNHIICQGIQVLDLFENEYRIDSKKLSLIENWSASEELLLVGMNKEPYTDKTNRPIRLIYVGWLEQQKGIDELIDLVKFLKKKKTSFTLDIVGDGRYRIKIKKYLQNEIESREVVLHSWINSHELTKIYSSSDILLLFSWEEGLPNAMVEAMSAGVIPAVTEVGNIPSVISDQYNGLLFKTQSRDQINEGVFSLINNIDKIAELSSNAHKTAKERFSMRKNIEKLIKLTQQIISYD